MFQKRNLYLDSSRGTSTQTIVNEVPEQCKTEEKDSEMDSERESIHSNWSKLIPVEVNKPDEALKIDAPQRKRTVRNIVLVPYKLRPKDWGSWKIKSPYATSTIASPPLDNNNQTLDPNQTNEKLSYMSPIVLIMSQFICHNFMKTSELFVINLLINVKFIDEYNVKLV